MILDGVARGAGNAYLRFELELRNWRQNDAVDAKIRQHEIDFVLHRGVRMVLTVLVFVLSDKGSRGAGRKVMLGRKMQRGVVLEPRKLEQQGNQQYQKGND
jgi:hypothetical protein